MNLNLKPNESPLRDVGSMMVGGVMISFSAVFVKLATVGPIAAGFYRTFFGGLVLVAVALLRRERLWRSWPALGWAVAAGLLFAGDLSLWHKSIHLVGPGLSTILANFQVFFLALAGALIFKEAVGIRLVVACCLAMIGLFFLVGLHHGMPEKEYGWGVLFGVLSAVSYAGYTLSLRKLMSLKERPSVLATMAVVSLVTAAVMGPEALALGESLAIPDLQSWWALGAYGVVSQVIGWALISLGLPGVPASRVGLILLMQPTLAFIWDIVFFGRPTDTAAVAGAALALAGIYLGMRRENKPKAGVARGDARC